MVPPTKEITQTNRARSGSRRRAAALAVLALAGAPATASALPAISLYYERAVMSAADTRCRLFTPEVSSALNAAKAQARGAALREGVGDAVLLRAAARAQVKANAAPCASRDLAAAADRVRSAFAGYSRLIRLNLPGDTAAWRADRTAPVDGPLWRLSQTVPMDGSPLTFGLVGWQDQPPRLVAVIDFADGPQPYAARLLVRDQDRAPQPYLDVPRPGSTARLPLQARTPPRSMVRMYLAETRELADQRLLVTGQESAIAFRFPAEAADVIAALDPREAITIEFLFSGRSGDTARRAYVEVGDFAAGRAFLTVARR